MSDWKSRAKPVEGGWKNRATPIKEENLLSDIGEVATDAGKWALGRIGEASSFLDAYSMAPIRAALLERSQGKDWSEAAKAYQANVGNTDAPSYRDLAKAYGVSDEPSIPNPAISEFIKRPIDVWSDPSTPKMSPAEAIGLGSSVAFDPLNAAVPMGGKLTESAAKTVLSAPKKVAGTFKNIAEEQAVKAGLGQNKAAFREMAGVTNKGLPRPEKVMGNIRAGGRTLLDTGSVPRFSTTEGVGQAAAKGYEKVGSIFGEISNIVDESFPEGAISGKEIADKILEYAADIPENVGGKAIQERLLKEAENIQNKMFTFKEAQKWKGNFPYKHGSADLLENSDSANKAIKAAFSDAMEQSVEDAVTKIKPYIPEIEGLHGKYLEAKKMYGPLKTVASASSMRQLGDLSNRFISPTDYAAGGIGAIDAAIEGAGMLGQGAQAGLLGAANKAMRNYGSAFVSRGADDIYKILNTVPDLEKYAPVFGSAARLGERGIIAYHNLLMNKDPEYKRAFLAGETQMKKEPYYTAGNVMDAVGLGKMGMAGIAIPLVVIRMFQKGNLKEAYNALKKLNPEESEETLMKAANQIREKYDPKSQAISRKLDFIKNQADDVKTTGINWEERIAKEEKRARSVQMKKKNYWDMSEREKWEDEWGDLPHPEPFKDEPGYVDYEAIRRSKFRKDMGLDKVKGSWHDIKETSEFDDLTDMLKQDPTMSNQATSSAYRKLDDVLYDAMPREQYRMFQELIHSDKFDEAKMLAQKYLNAKEGK